MLEHTAVQQEGNALPIFQLRHVLLGLVLPIVVGISTNQLAIAVGEHALPPLGWVALHACVSAVFGLAPLVAARLALGRWSEVRQAFGFVRVPWLLGVLSVICGLVVMILGIGIYTLIVQAVVGPGAFADRLFSQSSQTGWWFGVLLLVIGPLSEEVFFRGFLAALLTKRSWWLFLVVSSVLFALLHQEDVVRTLPLVWSGLIFASVRVWTRSLYPSLMIHALYNAIPLFVLLHRA